MIDLISRFSSAVIRVMIRVVYQQCLGPMLRFSCGPGAGCRFSPTCSNYFLQAVELHGPLMGSWRGICRIFRCHPWGGSGYDPVPPASGVRAPKSSCSCHGETPHS